MYQSRREKITAGEREKKRRKKTVGKPEYSDTSAMLRRSLETREKDANSLIMTPTGEIQHYTPSVASIKNLENYREDVMKMARKMRVDEIKGAVKKVLDSQVVEWVSFLLTVYSIFIDDIMYLAIPTKISSAFYIAETVVAGLFVIELILESLVVPGYFGSFFFWLDLLSLCSLGIQVWFSARAAFSHFFPITSLLPFYKTRLVLSLDNRLSRS